MRIAVAGAGIFGVTTALRLAKEHDVEIFDCGDTILCAASRTNQLRLHRGYHYPRSPETTFELLESISSFEEEYESAVVDSYDHYYAIAREDSLVTVDQYLDFCEQFNLEYRVVDDFHGVDKDAIECTIEVRENLLDYRELYDICTARIRDSKIKLQLGRPFERAMVEGFDLVVNCTYANINGILRPEERHVYKYQVCEKIVVEMPTPMKGVSLVVVDGPFMCVDPYGRTDSSLLGNVVHAIHATNVGEYAEVPAHIQPLLNRGIVDARHVSKLDKFVESGREYIPSLADAKYLGSMFTVRTVLPNVKKTDARPTLVNRVSDKVINVYSGKIDTCSIAAQRVVEVITQEQETV